jgi:DNA-binding LacI/PurR family transcriptional regulator
MEPRRRPVTSNDVARRAGVSQATVSLVLSGKAAGRVSAATEATVRGAAEALGYRPNLAARALRTGSARAIGLVVPDVTHPFMGRVLRGAQTAARREGYAVVLVDAANDWTWEVDSFEVLRNSAVDGFLLFGVDPPRQAGDLEERMVAIESDPDRLPAVRLDVEAGGAAIAEHLLGLGHRRLGRIACSVFTATFRHREAAWAEVLAAAGVDPEAVPRTISAMNVDAAVAAAAELLEARPLPTGVFCDDDVLAAGLYVAARERGLRVPDDLSVVGFDDIRFSRHMDPPLTTIAQPMREIGEGTVRLVLDILSGKTIVPTSVTLPHRLVVRGSTARARASSVAALQALAR